MLPPYVIEPTAAGWRVAHVNADGCVDGAEAVAHRQRDVAFAYAEATAALGRYLASLDRREDSAELFEIWRALDDRYEMMAIAWKDAPTSAVGDPWADALAWH